MNFLFSSIGKKIQVALSGIFLIVFLLFHLLNNTMLFAGRENFNSMVQFLEGIKPLIRIMEVGLLAILLIHTINAIKITLSNKKLKPIQYNNKDGKKVSTLNSRTMAISGTTILIFFIIHLFFIWGTYQTHSFVDSQETYYDVLLRPNIGYLNHTPTAIFYVLSILLIGHHLKHGFQSALKTLGIINQSNIFYRLGFIVWGLIPAGFIAIIISIQIGVIK